MIGSRKMQLERDERNKRILTLAAIALALAAYALICEFTAFRVPCVFHEVTGLDCPGCGITRMCMHIAHFDYGSAFLDNGLAFVTSPVIVYLVGCVALRYVGVAVPEPVEKANSRIAVVLIAAFLVFGIVRNLVQF